MQTHHHAPKYTPDSAVAKLKARESELVDLVTEDDPEKQKWLDELQSCRAAIKRWEDAMEERQ
jgi:hypothetical protein